jgi:hypothetical protein
MPMSTHDAKLPHASEADQVLEPLHAQRQLGFLQGRARIEADLKVDFAVEIEGAFQA